MVAYASINMDNFSTIIGTGSLKICITQILINIFKFLVSLNCDEFLQRHCQETKKCQHQNKITCIHSRQD